MNPLFCLYMVGKGTQRTGRVWWQGCSGKRKTGHLSEKGIAFDVSEYQPMCGVCRGGWHQLDRKTVRMPPQIGRQYYHYSNSPAVDIELIMPTCFKLPMCPEALISDGLAGVDAMQDLGSVLTALIGHTNQGEHIRHSQPPTTPALPAKQMYSISAHPPTLQPWRHGELVCLVSAQPSRRPLALRSCAVSEQPGLWLTQARRSSVAVLDSKKILGRAKACDEAHY